MQSFTEPIGEDPALVWLESLGYAVVRGPDIAAGMPGAEHSGPNHCEVVLKRNRALQQNLMQRRFTLGGHE
jgi:type I restriction enzyme, R subunit